VGNGLVVAAAATQDPCASHYAAQPYLLGMVACAVVLQLVAVGLSVASLILREPRAGWWVLGSVLLTVCAVPAALIACVAVDGFCLTF
jgi:hypothetical protein